MIHHVASQIKPQHDSIWIPALLLHFPGLHFLYGCSRISSFLFPPPLVSLFFFIRLFFIFCYYFLSLTATLNPPPCFLLRGRRSFRESCTNLQFTCSPAHLKYPSMHQVTSAPAEETNDIRDDGARLQSFKNFDDRNGCWGALKPRRQRWFWWF